MRSSEKPRNSSGNGKRRGPATIDWPFAPDIHLRARQIVDGYQIVVRVEDGEFVGRGLELPESIGVGLDPKACVEETRAVMSSVAAYLLETGKPPPPPASEGARTEQVNVRFSAEERLALETSARQQGFRSVSDFVRAAVLARPAKP